MLVLAPPPGGDARVATAQSPVPNARPLKQRPACVPCRKRWLHGATVIPLDSGASPEQSQG